MAKSKLTHKAAQPHPDTHGPTGQQIARKLGRQKATLQINIDPRADSSAYLLRVRARRDGWTPGAWHTIGSIPADASLLDACRELLAQRSPGARAAHRMRQLKRLRAKTS